MKFTTIQSFKQIELHAKTLLVFDVDDTIVRYERMDRAWWQAISDKHFAEHGDRLTADMLTYTAWHDEISRLDPLHTDEDGLSDLLQRAKGLQCKVIFLTARKEVSHEITAQHLSQLGIDHSEIYYTNIVGNKGKVLNELIESRFSDFHDYVFVDDVEANLLAVREHVDKDVRCFKFAGSHGSSVGALLADEHTSN